MKIESQRNIVQIDSGKLVGKRKVQPEAATSTGSDSVDSKLSNALKNAVDGIKDSGLTAGQIHSQVDEVKASGLLKSSEVDSVRPRMNDSDLLKLADHVAAASQASPAQALDAFNELDPNRVAQLV